MNKRIRVPNERGVKLLHNPIQNKGTAFTIEERKILGLRGLLPPRALTQDMQAARIMENFHAIKNDLDKYVFLVALQDRNESLFYYIMDKYLEEIMPVVYTPTVGQACQAFGHIYRRARGLYLSIEDKGYIREILLNWPRRDVRVIVVTDGARILGLGDLGVNGMGIPIGKLALYTGCAGIDPEACLPITIDVGTNNRELLNDPLYLGRPQERIKGAAYMELIDEFVLAVQEIFPDAVLQFEDFATENAFSILEKYRYKARVFNDDIQGTASVTLAGILSSLRITGAPLSEQRILYLGAGEAGIGIGKMLCMAMMREGLSEEEAKLRNWFVDSQGLVCSERKNLADHKRHFAHTHHHIGTFSEAIRILKPTAIVGVSGQPGTFTEAVLQEMAIINEKPIIFALSNPTSKSECTAEEAYRHTEGRAIFASGSPFAPVQFEGRNFVPGQANNVYIFPGLGLGVMYSKARLITEEMFYAAAAEVSSQVSAEELESGATFPSFKRIKEVSLAIAKSVTKVAHEQGLTHIVPSEEDEDKIRALMYNPEYAEYR